MTGLVTNAGLANIIAAWDAYASRARYLQFGTGSGQVATDTDLAGPVETRAMGHTSIETLNVAGDTLKITGCIAATADRVITEVGAFDAASGGNLGIYGDFAAINLATGDTIAFAISVTVA